MSVCLSPKALALPEVQSKRIGEPQRDQPPCVVGQRLLGILLLSQYKRARPLLAPIDKKEGGLPVWRKLPSKPTMSWFERNTPVMDAIGE